MYIIWTKRAAAARLYTYISFGAGGGRPHNIPVFLSYRAVSIQQAERCGNTLPPQRARSLGRRFPNEPSHMGDTRKWENHHILSYTIRLSFVHTARINAMSVLGHIK